MKALAYIFENKLDGVMKVAIAPNNEPSEKQIQYQDLISRVKESYPLRDLAYSGKDTQLYWCEDCEEINLWTYWQGRGNLDAKTMLVGQDWGYFNRQSELPCLSLGYYHVELLRYDRMTFQISFDIYTI